MIIYREHDKSVFAACLNANYSPIQSLVIANRIKDPIKGALANNSQLSVIEPYTELKNAIFAGERIASAVQQKKKICLLTDYDVDGITSSAMMQHAICGMLRHPYELLTILIGHRIHDGYGITDSLVNRVLALSTLERPDLIVTADCGSSDEERIRRLADHGIEVIVTDHHAIPKSGVPKSALTVVNPCQAGCRYKDKTIAGVTTAWLVMWAAYDYAFARRWTGKHNMTALWDFVALGTVADCVSIASPTNRIVIKQGLELINAGTKPCWHALLAANNGRPIDEGSLGFQIGPRINACSRMDDPYAAVDFLMSNDIATASELYGKLTELNEDRKAKEVEMTETCMAIIESYSTSNEAHASIVAYDPSFHPGVQGIVASRIVEKTGKPAFVFSPSQDGLLSASGRTIELIHLRDALEFIDARDPSILNRFGGHKAACGAHIRADKLGDFKRLFEEAVRAQFGTNKLEPATISDGDITSLGPLSLDSYDEIAHLKPFGREFEPPLFTSRFKVLKTHVIGKVRKVHLKVLLQDQNGIQYSGVWFNALKSECAPCPLVEGKHHILHFELSENTFNQVRSLQLILKGST